MPEQPDFLHREVPALGRRIHRLGLATSYGLDPAGVRAALDLGLQYVFWTPRQTKVGPALREALKQDRERYVIATGPTFGYFASSLKSAAEDALRQLDTDYLDVFQVFWLGKTSAWTEGVQAELLRLREEGKVRAIGVSIHDRERAGLLARESALDLLMVRYNAAHPGAERDIFPHLAVRNPALVAYTATRWNKLLKRPRGWTGRVPTAADCYRFCLSSPHVDLTLTGPKDLAQLKENLAGLEKGPMEGEEMAWMREFGKVVHG